MNRINATIALGVLAVIALGAFTLALGVGSVSIGPAAVLQALLGDGDVTPRTIVRGLRLPRALAGFATGGSLALAGALLQVLLRNPLADPYVMGVSGGAAVGALLAMLLGASPWLTPAGAFGGGLLSTVMVFGLARGTGAWSPTRLLLTGVIVASGWGAMVALLLSLAPETQLRGMLFWLIGDLSSPPAPWLCLAALVLGVAVAMHFARDLNALARGETAAAALGVSRRLAWLLFALAALLTATAVTTAGAIGFVGLIVPHAVRLVAGNDQRLVLPASALAGGALLLIADTLARQVLAPAQLPVGVITALIGVPLFLWLLRRDR
ncbi:MAG: iron ABC transporter permease [Pseudomonadota bacterium]|nr:iron ABC transporter permease [Pseudomonadota bacterium]